MTEKIITGSELLIIALIYISAGHAFVNTSNVYVTRNMQAIELYTFVVISQKN